MTVNEEVSNTARKAGLKSAGAVTPVRKAVTISQLKNNPISRTPTGISEFDRVVGGGLVDAEVILFAAFPGSGKSTLSLDIANQYAISGKTVLYSSGEESEQQIGLRAKRMKVTSDNIHIVSETNLETLLGHINELNPELVIVDSLQTIASSEIPGSIGSLQQSKEAAHTLTRIAKQQNITMILISQVIKNGDFSGSESIQHIVDCALMLESDKNTPLKFLRASKNRFGDTNEVGVFQHSETKLEEIIDPSGIFTENSDETVIGSSCSFISEGVRQIPVEIQALVTPSTLPQPRKQFNGVNHQRAQIVCAILDKFCRAKLYENDVFVSTVSGVKVIDPQADLSIAASILSSSRDSSIPSTSAFIGELSLTGQVRGAFMIENKVAEAVRLGFTKIIIPKSAKVNDSKFKNIEIVRISTVKDLPALIKS
jgi:DNA repair protein RadA/Sms